MTTPSYIYDMAIMANSIHVQLDSLRLGWCKLGPEGARSVADLLMFNSSLTSLDLRGNELGNDGAIILGRAFK
jgi:Ran GTPase-activating protein (RanGAP) involved in mRNA processing and transport